MKTARGLAILAALPPLVAGCHLPHPGKGKAPQEAEQVEIIARVMRFMPECPHDPSGTLPAAVLKIDKESAVGPGRRFVMFFQPGAKEIRLFEKKGNKLSFKIRKDFLQGERLKEGTVKVEPSISSTLRDIKLIRFGPDKAQKP